MITKTAGFKACDGVVYATIEEARVAEMRHLLNETDGSAGVDTSIIDILAADLIKSQADNLLAILTTGPRSRPKTRKAAGTTAPKRARARAATPAQVAEGFKAVRAAVDDAHDDTPTAAGARAEAAMDAVR